MQIDYGLHVRVSFASNVCSISHIRLSQTLLRQCMDDVMSLLRYSPPVDEEIPEEEAPPTAKPMSRKEREREAKKAEEDEAEQVRTAGRAGRCV